MEKEIVTILAVFILVVCSCRSKPVNKNITRPEIVRHDTVYFGSERSLMNYGEKFLINKAVKSNNGIAIWTSGKGVNVWIDSLLYFSKHRNKFVAVSSTLDHGFSLLYYNEDSLSIESISINQPVVREYKTSKFKVISIIDSCFNSGYLIKSILFYKINNDGTLRDKREFFPRKKEKRNYDFYITTECKNNSVVIYKNKAIEYIYK